ncbi:MAG TPA: 1-acyl-sn-glycerol-3-phosphate acyltransferase [Verrucomicrobiales bacterium]|nr:1-acyl-sn-glycerol-3-phosphate acyltransferase [Verrucomicrobiales bacterium]
MMKLLSYAYGCAGIAVITVVMPLDFLFNVLLPGRRNDQRARSRLLHRWAKFSAGLFGCRVTTHGRVPDHGLCVSNHLSYLDIPAYGSVAPMVFVSKADVRRWPLFGAWAAMCGTLFIKRENKGHVADVGDQMEVVLKTGVPLVVFPEGTSSGGETVLPFKSSLFQPAIDHQWPVTPMWIGYELDNGTVAEDVAYWGDMTLLPHLFNLFTRKGVRATVAFGEPLEPGTNRKELCQRAHAAVEALREKWQPGLGTGSIAMGVRESAAGG